MSGPQLQWAIQTEFPNVVRLFELNCCAIPLTAAGRWRHFCSTRRSGRWTGLGTQDSEVDMPLTGGASGAAHPSDSCTVVFIEIAADSEGQLESVSEVPVDSVGFSSDGRATTHFVFGPHCCMGREMQRKSRKLVHGPLLAPQKKNRQV